MFKKILPLLFVYLFPYSGFASTPAQLPGDIPVWKTIEITDDGVDVRSSYAVYYAASGQTAGYGIQCATPIRIPDGSEFMTVHVYQGVADISSATAGTVYNATGYCGNGATSLANSFYKFVMVPRKEDIAVGVRQLAGIIATSGRAADATIMYPTSDSAIPIQFRYDRQHNANASSWIALPDIDAYGVYQIPVAAGQWFTMARYLNPSAHAGPDSIVVQFTRKRIGRSQ